MSQEHLQEPLPDPLDWEEPFDRDNPRDWPNWKKIYHTFIITAIALAVTVGSSIYTPGRDDVESEFSVSSEVSLIPYVLYVLGLAIGSLGAGPCSENFGRRAVYLIGLPIFGLFTIGAAVSNNVTALSVCRFFAGFFGSPGLLIGSPTLADMFDAKEIVVPMAMYITTTLLGPSIGPLIGGFVADEKGWRWTQWTLLFFTAAGLLPALGMKETYKTVILKRRANARGIPHETSHFTFLESAKTFFRNRLGRPVHMAIVEPVVGLFTLYIGINFGVVYGFFAAFPYVFEDKYGFGTTSTGLTFIGLGVGCLIAGIFIMLYSRIVFRKQTVRSEKTGNEGYVAPEKALYLAMVGSICLPVSLFWFGWSAQARVHWICPVIAEGVYGFGNVLILMSCTLFVMDFYGPLYGASAMAANNMARYVLGAAFPLFIVQMYEALDVGWATSLLGFISLLLTPIPWAFYVLGPKLRDKSRYIET